MALSTNDRTELERLKDLRASIGRRMERAKEEWADVNQQIEAVLRDAGVTKAVLGNEQIMIQTVVDWQHFDEERVATEYPMDEYPDIYRPTYKATKAFLNEQAKLHPNDNRLVSRFTGFRERILVTTVRRNNWRKKK